MESVFHRSKTIDASKKHKTSAPSSPNTNILPSIQKSAQLQRQGSMSTFTPNKNKAVHVLNYKTASSSPRTPKMNSKSVFGLKESIKSAFNSKYLPATFQKSASVGSKNPMIKQGFSAADTHTTREQVHPQAEAEAREPMSPKEPQPVEEPNSPQKEEPIIKPRKQGDLGLSVLLSYKEESLAHLEGLQRRQKIEKCLQRHKVTAHMRTNIVDWVYQTYSVFEFEEHTFFTTINLFDRYLAATREEITANELHLLSITIMSIATKFEEVASLTMSEVHEKLGHKMFPKEEISKTELEILQTLGFYTSTVSALDFLNQFTILLFEENSSLKIVFSLARLLLKVNLYDYEMCSISPSLQAASAILISLTLCEKHYSCTLIDGSLLHDLSRISKQKPDTIQAIAEKTLYNIANMAEKFPKMESIIKGNSQLFNQFFPTDSSRAM